MIALPTASQTRQADAYTVAHSPISSVDLMERAAAVFTKWFCSFYGSENPVVIFAGMGNNGGDGLCIARLLNNEGYDVGLYVFEHRKNGSEDFQYNLERLRSERKIPLLFVDDANSIAQLEISADTVLIDALLGSGLNRPLEGSAAKLVELLNEKASAQQLQMVAVDIPSGLSTNGQIFEPAIQASRCLSFEFPKLAFLLAHSGESAGKWDVHSIGLDPNFIGQLKARYHLLEQADCLLTPKKTFSHKGNYGHLLIEGGARGKQGAVYLAAEAALRSGVGLCSVALLDAEVSFNPALPELMHLSQTSQTSQARQPSQANQSKHQSQLTQIERNHSLVIGPGMGTDSTALERLKERLTNHNNQHRQGVNVKGQLSQRELLAQQQSVLLDADALNLLAAEPALWDLIPKGSILTPHPGEFDRLFPISSSPLSGLAADTSAQKQPASPLAIQRLEQLEAAVNKHEVIIILKGAYTCIGLPASLAASENLPGQLFFNSTGNPGMATAGSGDVLSGVIGALLSQNYSLAKACFTAVWAHGKAGDLAALQFGTHSMKARDIVAALPAAFKILAE